MRNLKKTLCLVLALVFVLGLCTVGAAGESAAKFSDAESIQYKTQVDAMTGLGILIGYPDGTFKPLQNVTRAEAAKMISYMMVGTDEVEKWPAKQVFDDVPADHWAAKYITFCEYNDVINGYGDGNFGPSDKVTRAQLAKMLLAACGYGKKGELVGEGWDQNAARLAFECDVLKDIKTTDDWNSPATREETALMVFNTMMRTYRVVLGDDVDDYVPAWINGDYDVTFAESPWGMFTRTGIIYNNKANTKNAKGTTIKTASGVAYTIETAADDDASVLGHEVTVVYRTEGVEPYAKNVAYLVIDDCVEVGGSAANYYNTVGYAVTVAQGTVTPGVTLMPAKGVRASDFKHVYIVNADNLIVGWKTVDGFTIVPVSINAYTGVAKVRPVNELVDQEVVLPAGVKQGDLVCLFKCGEIYSIQPTTKVENIAITQKQANVIDQRQIWSYNNGEVWPTSAENITKINLASLTCMNPQEIMKLASDTDDMVWKYEPVLKVGYTYTIYFDCFGKAFAYGDERLTNEAAASYYLFLCDFDAHDVWHVGHRYAQVMKPDGTIEKVLTTVEEGTPLGYTRGDIVKVIPLGYRSYVAKASEDVTEIRQPYQIADVQYDFGTATYCQYGWYNPATGKWNDLDPDDQTAVENARADLVYRGSTSRPKTVPAAEVSIVYKVVKIGTAYIRIVDTVWFMEAGSSSLYTKGSYIYVTDFDIYQQKWLDKTVNFYDGLKDGEWMEDLRLFGDDITNPAIVNYPGFNRYYKIGDDYVLDPVEAGDGTADGVRSIYLVDADSAPKDIPSNNYCFYVKRLSDTIGKLWVEDANGVRWGIDVSNTKFVRLAPYYFEDEEYGFVGSDYLAGYPIGQAMPLDSIAAIQQLLLSQMKGADGKTYTFKLDITFVEKIDPITKIHSIDGDTIYITGISVATIDGEPVPAAE